jgi:branched-chain amino acid transport system permease protein
MPIWVVIPLAAALAGLFGVLLGAPTLKLRGDYLAIVTLGFGEIIRVFMNNLEHPVNITNGPRGISQIDPMTLFGVSFGKPLELFGLTIPGVALYYYLFLALVVASVVVCHRLETSRVGRAWMAIREDEIAAKAMGHEHPQPQAAGLRHGGHLRWGVRLDVCGLPGLCLAGVVHADGVGDDRRHGGAGGAGAHPGVILGAVMLAALPEVLRYVAGDMQNLTGGRIDAAILRQLLIALAMITSCCCARAACGLRPSTARPLRYRPADARTSR